jgi:hypothetical protein
MPLPVSHINGTLAASILKRPPRAYFNQTLNDVNRRTSVSRLVQWREQ